MRMPRSAAWQRTASVWRHRALHQSLSKGRVPRPPHARLDGGGTVERLEGVDDPLGRWPRALVIHHWHLLVVDLPWTLTHAHRSSTPQIVLRSQRVHRLLLTFLRTH